MRGTVTYWHGMFVLYGIEGIDWNYLVSCELYWRMWVRLNRD
jgi:hypothetical protein